MGVVMQQAKEVRPVVTFSEAAVKHLVSYLSKNKEPIGVRLSVKKTGCSGFSYVVDYVKEAKVGDSVLDLSTEYQVFIDKASTPFLNGMHVDYVKQGLNFKFIFNNPNQTGQCGCGESFTIN